MRSRRLVWYLSLSVICYLVANSLLTRYVDPSGTFGLLAVVPIWFAVRLWGRTSGLSMAGAAVVLNSIVYVGLGDGIRSFGHNPVDTFARVVLEIIAFGAVVAILDRIEAARRELGASRLRERLSTELLSETERKYRTLVELAPEAVVVAVDSRIVYSNRRLLELSGYRMEEVLGTSFLDFVDEEDRTTAAERSAARLEGETLPPTTIRYRRKDGEIRWIEIVGGKTEWDGDAAIMYLFSDVTERKALEQQLIQAQKMEAIGRLAGGIAHDFNNVLQVVIGYSEFIRARLGGDDAIERAVTSIRAASEKATSMTRQLLSFSRKQELEPEAVNLPMFLTQILGILRPLVGEDIHVTLETESDDLAVEIDPGQLQQVVMNLAANARDAMPAGGWLRLAVRRVEDSEYSSYIEIAVSDTGIGMDEEVLAHLYEPFFTTKARGKGTGLGLASVHDIVERSGGRLTVSSTKGIGTTFSIILPAASRQAADATQARARPGMREARAGKILVVEDDQQVRSLIDDVLTDAGYTVTTAANGSEAVKLSHGDGTFRLLICDYLLSGMTGTQTAAEVMKEIADIKLLFITGHSDWLDTADPSIVLYKPFTIEELLRALDRALGVPAEDQQNGKQVK